MGAESGDGEAAMGTFTTGTFTVVPTPVPKLGLKGVHYGATPPRSFSKEGNRIIDSYCPPTSPRRPTTGSSLASNQEASISLAEAASPGRLESPVIDFITVSSSPPPQQQRRPHTSRPSSKDATENKPIIWGAWAPTIKNKPPLLRETPRLPVSPRTHSFGPDIKPSAKGPSSRRLRPSTASNSSMATYRDQNTKHAKTEGKFPRGRSSVQEDKNDCNCVNDVVGWSNQSPTPPTSPFPLVADLKSTGNDDSHPQLFVRSLFSQEETALQQRGLMKSRLAKSARDSSNARRILATKFDFKQDNNLSEMDEKLLRQYRLVACGEMGEEHSAPPNVSGRVSDGSSSAGPMRIQSYAPLKVVPISFDDAVEKLETKEDVRAWRDKASYSRSIAVVNSPQSLMRLVSAKGTSRKAAIGMYEGHAQNEDHVQKVTDDFRVEGFQMDINRALLNVYDGGENVYESCFAKDVTSGGEESTPNMQEFAGERTILQKRMEANESAYHIQSMKQESFLTNDSMSTDVHSKNIEDFLGGTASPVPPSRPGSRPASARPAGSDRGPGSNPHTPALIAAELEMAALECPQEQCLEDVREDKVDDHGDESQGRSDSLADGPDENVVSDHCVHGPPTTGEVSLSLLTAAPGQKKLRDASSGDANNGGDIKAPSRNFSIVRGHEVHDQTRRDIRRDSFVCPSCNEKVNMPLDADHKQHKIVLTYIKDRSLLSPASSPSQSPMPCAELALPQRQHRENVRFIQKPGPRFRPGSAPVRRPTPSKGALKVQEQTLEVYRDRDDKKEQHRSVLEEEHAALKAPGVAQRTADTVPQEISMAVASDEQAMEETDKDKELRRLHEKLADAEEKLKHAEAMARNAAPVPDAVESASAETLTPSIEGTRTPPSAAQSPHPQASTSNRPPSGHKRASPGQLMHVRGARKESHGATGGDFKKADTAVSAVEAQAMLDAIDSLKAQLASTSAEAAAAEEQNRRQMKAKEEEMEALRQEMQHQAQASSKMQDSELKQLQADLVKARNEVSALRKQRDAKLAIHERQALKEAQDQLKKDQDQLAADQEQLRRQHKAALKDIEDGARVEGLRQRVDEREKELSALEADLRKQDGKIQMEWQRLQDRQAALCSELEVTCGDERHDKATLLKELRLTLSENVQLLEKCAQLEEQLAGNGRTM